MRKVGRVKRAEVLLAGEPGCRYGQSLPTSAAPGSGLLNADYAGVPQRSRTSYDAAGRVTRLWLPSTGTQRYTTDIA